MMPVPRRQSVRSPRRTIRPRLEPLEPRLTLDATTVLGKALGPALRGSIAVVDGTLTIQGTSGADHIQVEPTRFANRVLVVDNDKVQGTFDNVTAIDVNAGGGNDTVAIDPRITLPTQLDGGAGNDRLRGGSGPNTFLDGSGKNVFFGRPGRDQINLVPGQDRLVVSKSLGVIQVTPSASRTALRTLSGTYKLAPLQVASGPIVMSAADLRTPSFVRLAKRDYQSGQPVALTNATPKSTADLARLLGVPNPPGFPSNADKIDLLAFRKTVEGRRAIFNTSILRPPVAGTDTPAQTAAERTAAKQGLNHAIRSYLDGVFSITPAVSAPPASLGDSTDLTSIANQYQLSACLPLKDIGASEQLNNTVYDVRSFSNVEDFYLTVQELDVQNGTDPFKYVGAFSFLDAAYLPTGPVPLNQPATLLTPSPQSNPGTTSYTTGGSVTVGGSIGVNEAQGFNAMLNASVTVTNSQTVTVPPISISYQGDPVTARPFWAYFYNDPQQDQDSSTFLDQWVWRVPFTSYPVFSIPTDPTADQDVAILSYAFYQTEGDPHVHNWNLTQFVPKPFQTTYQLGKPSISDVSPLRVLPGNTFTIEGFGFYPSLVQGVLVGGVELPASNFHVDSDTQITVVAPNTPGNGLPVIVRTTQGFSNTNVKVNILAAPVLSVQAQPFSAVPGQAFTGQIVGIITDPDPNVDATDFATTIMWGDGTSTPGKVVDAGGGTFDVLGSHTYLAAGSPTFTVQVSKSDGELASATGTATVKSGPDNTGGPQNLVAQPITASANQAFSNVTLATFTDSDPGVDPSSFTAAVDWGDGSSTASTTVTLAGPGMFDVLGTHTYSAAGSYPFSVQVTDSSSRKAKATGTIVVS